MFLLLGHIASCVPSTTCPSYKNDFTVKLTTLVLRWELLLIKAPQIAK